MAQPIIERKAIPKPNATGPRPVGKRNALRIMTFPVIEAFDGTGVSPNEAMAPTPSVAMMRPRGWTVKRQDQ